MPDTISVDLFLDGVAALIQAGDIARAASRAAELQSAAPLLYHAGMAAVCVAAGRTGEAMQHAQMATSLAAEEPSVLLKLADAQRVNGDLEGAEETTRKAVNRDTSIRSQRALGQLLLATDRTDAAERAFVRVLDREPDDYDAHLGLALAAEKRGDNPEALKGYAKAFTLAPADPRALRGMLRMYGNAGWALGAITLASVTRGGRHDDAVNVALDMMILLATTGLSPEDPANLAFTDHDDLFERMSSASASLPASVQLQVARMAFDMDRLAVTSAVVERLDQAGLTATDLGHHLYLTGLLADRDERSEDALDAYLEALDAGPERWDACRSAPSSLMTQADPDSLKQAEELFLALPGELRSSKPALLFNEAIFQKVIGRHEDAVARFHALLERVTEGSLAEAAREALAELKH